MDSQKTTASIRIDSELLNVLKNEAKAENRSLSNYIETVFYRFGYRKDNAETLSALQDAKDGKSAGIVDANSYETFLSSVFDEEN